MKEAPDNEVQKEVFTVYSFSCSFVLKMYQNAQYQDEKVSENMSHLRHLSVEFTLGLISRHYKNCTYFKVLNIAFFVVQILLFLF